MSSRNYQWAFIVEVTDLKQQVNEQRKKESTREKELDRERLNSIRLQQKFEQDFDFHKQMVVNDCGRHIEELQEEHREHIRNIERKLSTDQRIGKYQIWVRVVEMTDFRDFTDFKDFPISDRMYLHPTSLSD